MKDWVGEPEPAGYSQTGAFRHDDRTDGWIGFLFDTSVEELEDSDQVTMVEMTKGTKPGLMRDGC